MSNTSKSASKTKRASVTRRQLLGALWIGLGLVALLELIWVGVAFLRHPGRRMGGKTPPTPMQAGPVVTFAAGSVTAFPRGQFYLARLVDGGFLALSRQCPHLGCTLPWVEQEQRFVCPCHASIFDIRGDVLRSPAPRAMAVHPVRIENETVWVDTRQVHQRSRFDPSQAVYPQRS